jgi:predicted transcriptional regulator with HTH domain
MTQIWWRSQWESDLFQIQRWLRMQSVQRRVLALLLRVYPQGHSSKWVGRECNDTESTEKGVFEEIWCYGGCGCGNVSCADVESDVVPVS